MIKIKLVEIELVKIKYVSNPTFLESKFKKLNKIHLIVENLHEIKQAILVDYGGEFEMIGKISVGDQMRETHIRFRNITDYENSFTAFDEGYDSEDAIFNDYIYEIRTPHFILLNGSQY